MVGQPESILRDGAILYQGRDLRRPSKGKIPFFYIIAIIAEKTYLSPASFGLVPACIIRSNFWQILSSFSRRVPLSLR